MALDKVVVEFDVQAKELIDAQKKIVKGGKEIEKQSNKTTKTTQTNAQKRAKSLKEEQQDLKELKKRRNDAFKVRDIEKYNKRISESQRRINALGKAYPKVNKNTNKFLTTLKRLTPIAAGAFAVGSIVAFGKEMLKLATQTEQFERRANIVFGKSSKYVSDFAKKTAQALGLTENEFIGAAAAIGDILVPLGLSRERAAELSSEALKLGGVIREFSGTSKSAAEVSEILAKAFTGETEALKPLGIAIRRQTPEFQALIKTKMQDDGVTRQQAEGLAIYDEIVRQSSDAIVSYGTNTDSLVRKQNQLSANWKNLKEILSDVFSPALEYTIDLLVFYTGGVDDLNASLEETESIFEDLDRRLNDFQKLVAADTIPELTKHYDDLTNAQEANLKRTMELIQIQSNNLGLTAEQQEEYNQLGVAAEEIDDRLKFLSATIAELNRIESGEGVTLQELNKRRKELNELLLVTTVRTKEFSKVQGQLKDVEDEIATILGKKKDERKEDEKEEKKNKTLFRGIFGISPGMIKTMEELLEKRNKTIKKYNEDVVASQDELQDTLILSGHIVTDSIIQGIDNRIARLDMETEAGKKQAESLVKIQRSLFRFNQGLALANIALNLSEALSVASKLPPPLNVIQGAIAVATSIASAAQVSAQAPPELPAFAEGTKSAPGGMALIGEEGAERMHVPRGAKILTANQTLQTAPLFDAISDNRLDDYILSNYKIPTIASPEFDDYRLFRAIKGNKTVELGDRTTSQIGSVIARQSANQSFENSKRWNTNSR